MDEPPWVTAFRLHYNLPPHDERVEALSDIEILIDNRRWKYAHGMLNKDGTVRRTRNDNEYDDFEDLDEEGDEYEPTPDEAQRLFDSGAIGADEATRKRLLEEARAGGDVWSHFGKPR
jgi:hypothetical protein